MADDYKIVARIVAEDASDAGAKGAERRLEQVERRGLSVGATLGRMFAAMGGTYVFQRLARGIVGLNSELEQAQVGMATLLTANTGMRLSSSLRVSRDLLRQLREDAAGGAGELSDYLGGLQTMLGPGLGLGASLSQLRELNRNALAAGFALRGQEGMSLAGFDVAQALSGQVGDRTTPIVMQALQAAGITVEAFRKLRPEERIDALNRGFAMFAPGVEAMGQTWSAQMSTLTDNIKELARTATEPIFERWSGQLRRANDWLSAHQEHLQEIAGVVGQRLVHLWDTLVDRAGTYAALVAAASTYQAIGGAGGLAGAGRGIAGAAGRARGVGSQVWEALKDPFGFGATFGAALGTGGGSAGIGGLMSSLGGIINAAAPLASALGIIAGAFLSVRGALREWPALAGRLGQSSAHVMKAFGNLGTGFDALAAKGSALNMVGAGLLVVLSGLLDAIAPLVTGLAMAVAGFGAALQLFGGGLKAMWAASTAWLRGDSAESAFNASMATTTRNVLNTFEQIDRMWNGDGSGARGGSSANDGIPDVPGAKGGNVTNVYGARIEIKVEKLDDPARVEVALGTIFQRLQANRRQPRRLAAISLT